MDYSAAVWMAKAGQLEYERNLLLRYLDMRDEAPGMRDVDRLLEYRAVHLQVQQLRKRLSADADR